MTGNAIPRREFLGLVGGAALAATAAGRLNLEPGTLPRYRIGIQLYSVRDPLAKDFEGTLAALAAIGYQQVEFAGLHDHSPKDVRAILDRYGLKAPSSHVGIPAITDAIDQTIDDTQTLGHQYLILPWIPDESRTPDGYRRIAEMLNKAGDRLHDAGVALGYHNHSFEFAPLDMGIGQARQCGYDILLAATDPRLVVMELDLFWVRKGGRDAFQYFRDFPGRYRLAHVKDMSADGAMVDVGQGVIPWRELLAAARGAGVRLLFAEHDEPKDPMAFARTAYDYLLALPV